MNKYATSIKAIRFPSIRQEIDRLLFLSALFSLSLVSIRIIHTGHITFLSLIWNLFLAWLPYYFSCLIAANRLGRQSGGVFWFLFFIWILFIPNSFYILTDLFHLEDDVSGSTVPRWFDLILIISVAWNGLVMGILSVRQIEKIIFKEAGPDSKWLFLFPVMFLNGLGVYIGRYLRYNSWDVFFNPFDLIRDIGHMILHPFAYRDAWGMIFCFTVLLMLIYGMLKQLSRQSPFERG